MTKSATIYGMKVRTTSNRRYVVVIGRTPEAADDPLYAEPLPVFARVEARSDSWKTIVTRATRMGCMRTGFSVIWDTSTGEIFDRFGRPV